MGHSGFEQPSGVFYNAWERCATCILGIHSYRVVSVERGGLVVVFVCSEAFSGDVFKLLVKLCASIGCKTDY